MHLKKGQRTATIHEKEILLNKEKLRHIIESRNMDFIELHYTIQEKYGLDLQYKGFMNLIDNRSTWKLLYAHAITQVLGIDYMDIFEVVDINVEKVKIDKERWKEKYERK